MIIRLVQIQNWRGIRAAEHHLEDGVNVLKGLNETGKSSTVEAIEWALYRDVSGGARVSAREVEAILPAHDPDARPLVSLHLEFSDCSAIITKVLDTDAARRGCRLVVERPGRVPKTFERAEAQARLKSLLAADGWGGEEANRNGMANGISGASAEASPSAAPDVPLLISRQGAAADLVEGELSNSIRATLTLTQDGAIAPGARLERARAEVARRRGRELFDKLKHLAVDSAKKQSEAATARDALDDLRRRREECALLCAKVEELRLDIAQLARERARLGPRAAQWRTRLAEMRRARDAQLGADTTFAESRRERDAATARHDNLQKAVAEIARLSASLQRDSAELERVLKERAEAQALQQESQREYDRLHGEAGAAQKQIAGARREVEAWEKWLDAHRTKKEWRIARNALEQLEEKERDIEAARAGIQELPPIPSEAQITAWRRQWQELSNLRERVEQGVQVAFVPHQNTAITWSADGGAALEVAAESGVEMNLNGAHLLTITVPGVGDFTVQCGDPALRRVSGDLERRQSLLSEALSPWGIMLAELPDAFDLLEQSCRARAESVRDLQRLEAARRGDGGDMALRAAREEVEACRQRLDAARAACEPVRHRFAPDLKLEDALRSLQAARKEVEERETAANTSQSELRLAARRLNEHAANLGDLNSQARVLERARDDATMRLEELNAGNESEEARAARLEELRVGAEAAEAALQAAQEHRAALGKPVGEIEVGAAERQVEDLGHALHERENELLRLRNDLKHACERDPATELEQLDFEIETRSIEVARHEARLRGLAMLEAALESERHRIGRALAEPLNRLLSPWLSQIRGKDTWVELDDSGARITRVRTKDEDGMITLDFADHSEGMKEQTALVLRLIMAQLAAQRLPGGRLPVILDDPLTQSDTTRRPGLHRVLNEAAHNLQIIFVTCHEGHIEGIAAAHHIELGGTPLPSAAATPVELPEGVKGAVRRRKKVEKTESNGHTPVEKAEADTLSLW